MTDHRPRLSLTTRLLTFVAALTGGLAGVGVLVLSFSMMSALPPLGLVVAAVGVTGLLGAASLLAVVGRGPPVDRRRTGVALVGIALPVTFIGFFGYRTQNHWDGAMRAAMRSDLRSVVDYQLLVWEREGRFAPDLDSIPSRFLADREVVEIRMVWSDPAGFRAAATNSLTGDECFIDFRRAEHGPGPNRPDPVCGEEIGNEDG